MRWSLVLSALIAVQSALSFVCVALAIPPQSDEFLERREPKKTDPGREWKVPSKEYRKNAQDHPYSYRATNLGPHGQITKDTTVSEKKLGNGEKAHYANPSQSPRHKRKIHADHVFEVQMLTDHLKDHGIHDIKKGSDLHNKIKGILNHKDNMALIPGSINQSKGQMIKQGMQGKTVKRNIRHNARDEYAKLSYHTAHETAKKLDEALKDHKDYSKKVGARTLEKKLHDTYVTAGIHPGSSPSSRSSSPHAGPSSPHAGPSTPGPSRKANPGPSPIRRPDKRGNTSGNSPQTKKKGG